MEFAIVVFSLSDDFKYTNVVSIKETPNGASSDCVRHVLAQSASVISEQRFERFFLALCVWRCFVLNGCALRNVRIY